MRRTMAVFVVLLATCFSSGVAQDLDSLRADAIRARGFVRGSETQLTKFIAHFDSLRAAGAFAGDSSVVDTTFVQDTLPPVQDTTVVEVCPEGWTCTPPDTTAGVPMPSGFHIMGWFQSAEHPRDNGVESRWDAQQVDSFILTGGREDGPETWDPVELPGGATSHRRSLPYDSTTPIWRCIRAVDDGVESEPVCDRMDWSPMVRHEYEVVVSGADLPIAPGDRVLFVLQRKDGAWRNDASTRPDSVVFEVQGQRHVDEIHPHDFPGASDPWPVPTGLDSVIVNWRIYDGPGSKSGGAAFPVNP